MGFFAYWALFKWVHSTVWLVRSGRGEREIWYLEVYLSRRIMRQRMTDQLMADAFCLLNSILS